MKVALQRAGVAPRATIFCFGGVSDRSRQWLKTEVPLQRPNQLRKLRRCLLQAESGVVMQRGCVFVAPQAARGKVDDLLATVTLGDFQAQMEIHSGHHRQLADEHQPVF